MAKLLFLALVAASLLGCGGGGGPVGRSNNPGNGSGDSQQQATPTAAIATVTTQAASATSVLYAATFKLMLPYGVAVSADEGGKLTPGALQVADSGAISGGRFIPETAASRGYVLVNIADPQGFAVGTLATVTCSLPRGTTADTAAFSLDGFSAKDANGAAMAEITPHLEVISW